MKFDFRDALNAFSWQKTLLLFTKCFVKNKETEITFKLAFFDKFFCKTQHGDILATIIVANWQQFSTKITQEMIQGSTK